MNVLQIPPAAMRDEQSIEMVRAWIAEDGLHCSLHVGLWDESETTDTVGWGVLLADLIRHVAHASKQKNGIDFDSTVAGILEVMNNELENPTADVSGGKTAGMN